MLYYQKFTCSFTGITGVIKLLGARPGRHSNRAVLAVNSERDFKKWLVSLQVASVNPVTRYVKDSYTGLFKPLGQTQNLGQVVPANRVKKSKAKSLNPATLSGSYWDKTSCVGKSEARPLLASLINDVDSPRIVGKAMCVYESMC